MNKKPHYFLIAILLFYGCSKQGGGPGNAGVGGSIKIKTYASYTTTIHEAANYSSPSSTGPVFEWLDSRAGCWIVGDSLLLAKNELNSSNMNKVVLIYYSYGSNPDNATYYFSSIPFVKNQFGDLLGDAFKNWKGRDTKIRSAYSQRIDPQTGSYYGLSEEEFDNINGASGFPSLKMDDEGISDPDKFHKQSAKLYQQFGKVRGTQCFTMIGQFPNGNIFYGVFKVKHEDNVDHIQVTVKLGF